MKSGKEDMRHSPQNRVLVSLGSLQPREFLIPNTKFAYFPSTLRIMGFFRCPLRQENSPKPVNDSNVSPNPISNNEGFTWIDDWRYNIGEI
jgi:hypothetical protein